MLFYSLKFGVAYKIVNTKQLIKFFIFYQLKKNIYNLYTLYTVRAKLISYNNLVMPNITKNNDTQ